ncbi:MAG TPA: serine/threonine-protein kinase [Myxococcota bacterium]
MTDVDDLSGQIIAGRFSLTRQLGRGGMGAVYLAVDGDLPAGDPAAIVAVKVIKTALLDDASAVKRFEREAIAVGKLNHPHIVGFRGTGNVGGVSWLAMEFLEGQSLRERLAEGGAINWRDSLRIMVQIADGLAAAHAQGVVHRDLKPDNVMLVPTASGLPLVKLLDFGIAKQVDAEAMTMTGTGMIVGTPGFIAPEVIVSGVADDPRSDLYALGVVWFEMLTGARPFDASTPFALAVKHVQEPPPRPNSIRPFSPVPTPVENAVLQLLEKSPERRPPGAVALGNILQRLLHEADNPPEPATSTLRTEADLGLQQATETGMSFSPLPPLVPSSAPATEIVARAPKRAPLLLIAGVVGVVGVGVVGAVGYALSRIPSIELVVVDGGIDLHAHVDAGAAPVVDAGIVVAAPIVDAGVAAPADAGVVESTPTPKKPPATKKPPRTHKPKLLVD